MLERDLARLAATDCSRRLAGLEQAIWSRVEGVKRLRRVETITSRVQLLMLAATVIASTAIGVAIAQPPAGRPFVLQISAVASDLAPSSLFGMSP